MSDLHPEDDTDVLTTFEQTAIDAIEDDATAVELVQELPLYSLDVYEDHATDWHHKYALEPLVRAIFWKELMGWSMTRLHDELRGRATALGFDSAKFAPGATAPNRTTLGRAWRDRFGDDLQEFITRRAEWVLEHAHERGNPLGMRALESEDKSSVSKRTEERFIREKAHETIDEMRRLVFPTIDLDRPEEGTQYDDAAFLTLQSLLSIRNTAAEQGSSTLADKLGDDNTPAGDTHLHYIRQLSPEQISSFVSDGIEVMLDQAKRRLEFSRLVDLAIDITYVGYYGERDELVRIKGAPQKKDYEWCYQFATASIVGDNVKFTLALRPVQKGDTYGEIVRDLYWDAREHVSIQTVYADRAFYSADVLRSLNETGADYIIPAPKGSRLKNEVSRMTQDVEVIEEWGLYGKIAGYPGKTRAETTMVLLPSQKEDESTVAFTTNLDVDDETLSDRSETEGIINRYSRRWGIENSYKTIKDCLAMTTSKNFSVRWFYFGFAVLLYDMWLLVDFVIQVSLDCLEQRTKPRLTARRFLEFVRSSLLVPP